MQSYAVTSVQRGRFVSWQAEKMRKLLEAIKPDLERIQAAVRALRSVPVMLFRCSALAGRVAAAAAAAAEDAAASASALAQAVWEEKNKEKLQAIKAGDAATAAASAALAAMQQRLAAVAAAIVEEETRAARAAKEAAELAAREAAEAAERELRETNEAGDRAAAAASAGAAAARAATEEADVAIYEAANREKLAALRAGDAAVEVVEQMLAFARLRVQQARDAYETARMERDEAEALARKRAAAGVQALIRGARQRACMARRVPAARAIQRRLRALALSERLAVQRARATRAVACYRGTALRKAMHSKRDAARIISASLAIASRRVQCRNWIDATHRACVGNERTALCRLLARSDPEYCRIVDEPLAGLINARDRISGRSFAMRCAPIPSASSALLLLPTLLRLCLLLRRVLTYSPLSPVYNRASPSPPPTSLPTRSAVRSGAVSVVRVLLDSGIALGARDSTGSTALHEVASQGDAGAPMLAALFAGTSDPAACAALAATPNRNGDSALDLALALDEPSERLCDALRRVGAAPSPAAAERLEDASRAAERRTARRRASVEARRVEARRRMSADPSMQFYLLPSSRR